MRVIPQVNDDFPSGRFKGHKVFMVNRQTPSVRQMNPEWTERLRVQRLADLFDFHTSTHTRWAAIMQGPLNRERLRRKAVFASPVQSISPAHKFLNEGMFAGADAQKIQRLLNEPVGHFRVLAETAGQRLLARSQRPRLLAD